MYDAKSFDWEARRDIATEHNNGAPERLRKLHLPVATTVRRAHAQTTSLISRQLRHPSERMVGRRLRR